MIHNADNREATNSEGSNAYWCHNVSIHQVHCSTLPENTARRAVQATAIAQGMYNVDF